MSLFYVLSALLMAAAHYTLCDEASVVEASTAVSLWGDIAAGWLLANHKPLAGLVLIGTIVFAMWVVVSIVALDDATDRVMKEIAVQIVSTAVEDIVKGVVNKIDDERVTREVDRFTAMARMEINLEESDKIIAEINQRLKTIEDDIAAEKAAANLTPLISNVNHTPVIALASLAETGMSPTGPYHSGSILVDTSMRPYVAGVNRDWQKRVAAAEVAAEKVGALFEETEKASAAAAAMQVVAQIDLEDGEVFMELEDGEMSPSEIRLHDFNCRYAEINQMKRKLFYEYPEFADQSDRPASRPRNA